MRTPDRPPRSTHAPAAKPHPPMTQATVPTNPADHDLGTPGQNQEARLDESLEETFPASDPPSSQVIE